MDAKKENKQREELRNILIDLSKEQIILCSAKKSKEIYLRLEKLYHSPDPQEKFRHYYSDIFIVLTTIKQDPKNSNIQVVGQNLEILLNGYKAIHKDEHGNLIDVRDNIRKLYDHVNLDIARITYSDSQDVMLMGQEITDRLEAHDTKLNLVNEKAKEMRSLLSKSEQKANNMQKEYISILGIFASIILTFVGGITFSSSVLETMASVNIFRLILTIDLIAFVLINTIYILLKFLMLINGQDYTKLQQTVKDIDIIIFVVAVLTILLFCYILQTSPNYFSDYVKYSYSM